MENMGLNNTVLNGQKRKQTNKKNNTFWTDLCTKKSTESRMEIYP